MASVTKPTAPEVVKKTKLSELIHGTDKRTFLVELALKIDDAEAETALAITEARFDGDGWTARQVLALQSAIAYRTAASCLDAAWLQFATGTQEPLLMDPEAIEASRVFFHSEAERLESLVTSGTESSGDKPFALPAVGCGTFSVSASDRRPSERNALSDERDDVSSFDTERG